MGGTPQIFALPPLALLMLLCWFLVWAASALMIASVGDPEPRKDLPFMTEIKWSQQTKYVLLYSLFGFLWMMNFIIGCTQFIISAAAAIWYFTSSSDSNGKGSVCRGFFWIFRYHFGMGNHRNMFACGIINWFLYQGCMRFVWQRWQGRFGLCREGPGTAHLHLPQSPHWETSGGGRGRT